MQQQQQKFLNVDLISDSPNASIFSEMQFNQLRKKKCQKVCIIHKIAYSVDTLTRTHLPHILQAKIAIVAVSLVSIFSYKESILVANTNIHKLYTVCSHILNIKYTNCNSAHTDTHLWHTKITGTIDNEHENEMKRN